MKKQIRENYCMRGDCFDMGNFPFFPLSSEFSNCSTRPCATDCYKKTKTGSRHICNLLEYLKIPADNDKKCLPIKKDCIEDSLIAPRWGSDYYDYIAYRLTQQINGFSSCPTSSAQYDSNYIGPGTHEYKLVADGWLPITLADHYALIHDYMYDFSCGKEESIQADIALENNLRYAERKFFGGFPMAQNHAIAEILTLSRDEIQKKLGISLTAGPTEKGPGWNWDEDTLARAAAVMNALDESGIVSDWAFLNKYRCGSYNEKSKNYGDQHKFVFKKSICGKEKSDWCDKKKLTPQARLRNNNYKVCG